MQKIYNEKQYFSVNMRRSQAGEWQPWCIRCNFHKNHSAHIKQGLINRHKHKLRAWKGKVPRSLVLISTKACLITVYQVIKIKPIVYSVKCCSFFQWSTIPFQDCAITFSMWPTWHKYKNPLQWSSGSCTHSFLRTATAVAHYCGTGNSNAVDKSWIVISAFQNLFPHSCCTHIHHSHTELSSHLFYRF